MDSCLVSNLKMESNNYNKIIDEGNVLDFATLIETKAQLRLKGIVYLESEIDRILSENKVAKPALHQMQEELETDYFLIDLSSDNIDEIIDLFADLEVDNLGIAYETTHSARHYAKMLDKWNNLPDYR